MQQALRFTRTHLNTLVGLVMITLLLAGFLGRQIVGAHHEPANKYAAAGAAIDEVSDADPILTETMKVSTPYDLNLQATVECAILTYLRSAGSGTAGTSETSSTSGRVELWVEIDNERVPVQQGDVDPAPGVQNDNGEVTFCNRDYERTIRDSENLQDGIDEERDFIRTRTANAFNWIALDVGREYDKPDVPPGSGNNIIQIDLMARFTRQGAQPCEAATVFTGPAQEDCSDAFVGKRTLIAEPTNMSVHEAVLPGPGTGN